jgi:hypothetical protein
MTKWALTSPAQAAALARRLPAGAVALIRRGPSDAPAVKVPVRFRRRELAGLVRGPAALIAGRRAAGHRLVGSSRPPVSAILGEPKVPA